MSLLERIDGDNPGEIEPGKRLVRANDSRGSLPERLAYGLYRIAWRTPFQALRLRGRNPIRLLAVPKDPVAGDKMVGEKMLTGILVHGDEQIRIDTLDFAAARLSPAMFDYVHSFAWLRDLAAAATREKAARLAEKIMHHWLLAQPAGEDGPTARADLWGRRMLFWTAYAPYILSSADMVYRGAVLKMLARGSRHLEFSADKTTPGLPRVAAWIGVVASAVLMQGASARLGYGERGLARALSGAVHDDGGLISRSPAEQLLLVELLGQLRAVYYAGGREMPERISEILLGAAGALLSCTLGDDALSSWQGGNMLSKRRVEAAIDGSGARTRSLRQARGWGYQRLGARTSVVVIDAAPPPPPRALDGGCASTLAFEFSDGAERLVVNCGGSRPWSPKLAPALQNALRYTAAHSTLTLGDRNSTAVLQDGALGKGVTQVELSRDESAGISKVEAAHDGYVKRFGLVHQRRLVLNSDGRELQGEDTLISSGRRRKGEALPFAVRFHLGPHVEAATTADGQGALLRVRGGPAWQFRCRGGRLDIEDSIWIDGLGKARATQQLVISGDTPAEGMTISWQFRRAA
jgi:uncharacterized heparinase superfamily protein